MSQLLELNNGSANRDKIINGNSNHAKGMKLYPPQMLKCSSADQTQTAKTLLTYQIPQSLPQQSFATAASTLTTASPTGSPDEPTSSPSMTTTPAAALPTKEKSEMTSTPADSPYRIVDVWTHNLHQVFREISQIVKQYPYVAMDTEFPGVVMRPKNGGFLSISEFHYQSLKCNVDILHIIQLGVSFFDEHGNTPPNTSTYQFNFKFNIAVDMHASDSIELLKSSGIDFHRHTIDGIDPIFFAELLTTSGLVMMDAVTFLSFHSGYDFGYLMKLLTNTKLPDNENGFFEILKILFPNIYDVKYLMKSCKSLKGGLEEVARQLEIPRYGPSHQAGSDSLLTGLVFFRIRELYFEDNIDELKYSGHLFGLGVCSLYTHTGVGQLYTPEMHQNTLAAKAAAANAEQSTEDLTDLSSQDSTCISMSNTLNSKDDAISSVDTSVPCDTLLDSKLSE